MSYLDLLNRALSAVGERLDYLESCDWHTHKMQAEELHLMKREAILRMARRRARRAIRYADEGVQNRSEVA